MCTNGCQQTEQAYLNMPKTEFMLIASRLKISQFMESPSLTINENAVEQVTSANLLEFMSIKT